MVDTAFRLAGDDTAAQSVTGTGTVVAHVTDHGVKHVFIGTDFNDFADSQTVNNAFFLEGTVSIVVDEREERGKDSLLGFPEFAVPVVGIFGLARLCQGQE